MIRFFVVMISKLLDQAWRQTYFVVGICLNKIKTDREMNGFTTNR